ncbi:MAG: hypothetical protein ACQEQM_03180 [Thermoplasmatota archaeon]
MFRITSTTSLAATKHDRNFVGIDQKEEYLKLSIQRFEKQVNTDNQQTLNEF